MKRQKFMEQKMKQDPQTEQKGQLINNQCFFFLCGNALMQH